MSLCAARVPGKWMTARRANVRSEHICRPAHTRHLQADDVVRMDGAACDPCAGSELSQAQLQRVAEIMGEAGLQGRVSDGALRGLLAAASARILMMTAPVGGRLRAMVRRLAPPTAGVRSTGAPAGPRTVHGTPLRQPTSVAGLPGSGSCRHSRHSTRM